MKIIKSNNKDDNGRLATRIRIGSRDSKLALIQTADVISKINALFPEISCEIYKIKTSGDKITDRALYEIGGKALFIKELEDAIINKDIDVAVHSAKDLPPFISSKTKILATLTRAKVEDCLVSNLYNNLNSLPRKAIIGTCSPRRKAILEKISYDLGYDWQISPLRGNIETRINKLDKKQYDAIILASCALERLGYENRISSILAKDEFIPAGGQGFLVVQSGVDNSSINKIIREINNGIGELELLSERTFLQNLGASCFSPVSVYAKINNNSLNIEAKIYSSNGLESFYESVYCPIDFNNNNDAINTAVKAGIDLANIFKEHAKDLLQKIICN